MGDTKEFRRASILQMIMAATCAVATNIYVSYTNYISYYLNDIVGFSVVLAGSFITIFRIWDAFTDVGMGIIVDHTNTRIGKFRPYMIAGMFGSFIISHALIYLPPHISEGVPRKLFFVVVYMLFVLFTTMQACAQRSMIQVLTNDPKQRATMGMLNGIFLTVLYSMIPVIVFSRIIPATKGFNLNFFKTLLSVVSVISFVCMLLSVIAMSKHDKQIPKEEMKKIDKFKAKDAFSMLRHNRPLLMLVLSAGTDKLATTLQSNATIVVILFAIVCGNSKLNSAANSYTMWPSIIMILLGVGALGRKFGARRSLVFASWGGIVLSVLSIALWVLGNPKTLNFPGYDGFSGWSFFTIAYLVLWCLMKGMNMVATNSLNPMLADVIDYELYRSGTYCPGIIGSLFNLADKVISSLGPTIVAILCALIGFGDTLPTMETPYSAKLFAIGLLGMYGLALIGLIVNIICLKFYDLTPEKMAEIRAELKARKAEND